VTAIGLLRIHGLENPELSVAIGMALQTLQEVSRRSEAPDEEYCLGLMFRILIRSPDPQRHAP